MLLEPLFMPFMLTRIHFPTSAMSDNYVFGCVAVSLLCLYFNLLWK